MDSVGGLPVPRSSLPGHAPRPSPVTSTTSHGQICVMPAATQHSIDTASTASANHSPALPPNQHHNPVFFRTVAVTPLSPAAATLGPNKTLALTRVPGQAEKRQQRSRASRTVAYLSSLAATCGRQYPEGQDSRRLLIHVVLGEERDIQRMP